MTNWETCVQFHGHACGGLTIGYKAACYAAELLELSFSGDEQVVCIAENDGAARGQQRHGQPAVSFARQTVVLVL